MPAAVDTERPEAGAKSGFLCPALFFKAPGARGGEAAFDYASGVTPFFRRTLPYFLVSPVMTTAYTD